MIEDSSKLNAGQSLYVILESVQDRLSPKLLNLLKKNPKGKLVGYKMVDGNQFGLVIELDVGEITWFFEHELSINESMEP